MFILQHSTQHFTNKVAIPFQIVEEYSEQIHDLSRRFFHALLRQGQLVKSFRLAVDINDYDLFVDLHHAAKKSNMMDMADAAMIKVGEKWYLEYYNHSVVQLFFATRPSNKQ